MSPERFQKASFRRAGGYLLGRAIVLAALIPLVSVYAINQGRVLDFALLWFVLLTSVSFGLTLLTAVLIHRGYHNEKLLKAQPLWDVLYSSGLVFLSGGLSSPVVFIYPLIIIGAAMLFYRPGALLTATWASLAYGFLGILQVYKIAVPASPIHGIEIGGLSLPFRMAFHFVSFYAVAILAGYLAEELRRADKRLEEARTEIMDLENIQEAILHSMGGGLAAFDPSGRLMFCNEHGQKMLFSAGVDANDPRAIKEVFDLEKSGREEATLKDGSFFGYNAAPLIGRDGRRIGKILSFQDLTEIHRLEQKLKQSDRLAAVGRLAAGLAHEIRNPLASLSGSVQILSGNLCPEGGTEKQLITIVLRETERLNNLVTGFLKYARPQEAVKEEFDLSRLVDEVGLFFRQGEGRHNFGLVNRLPGGEKFYGNREAMEQLLLNLFRNSAEASPAGVTVTVEGRGLEKGGFELKVSDDGPGIPGEIAERIFEPFVSGRSSGTGLGLALVHRIVENHGGTVSLETSSPDGAVFLFRFGR